MNEHTASASGRYRTCIAAWASAILFALLALPDQSAAQSTYETELQPLIQQYCGSCHVGRSGRGGVNFSSRGAGGDFAKDPAFWYRSINALENRSMPENAQRLNFTEVKRQELIQLIRRQLRNPDLSKSPKDPGLAPLRMLTQYEYASAMRDLLGVTDLPLNKLPGDSGSLIPSRPGETPGISTSLLSRYMDVAEDVLDALPRERIVTVEPSETITRKDAARQILVPIQSRAFRRPSSQEDTDRLMSLFDRIEELGKPFDETLKITLTGVLASPKFLSHLEQPNRDKMPQPIDQIDLAARLSFFIWSSLPDEPLLQLASAKQLADPLILEQQVRRMLADPKAHALADNFGVQWLGIGRLRSAGSPTTRSATQPGAASLTTEQTVAMLNQAVKLIDPIFREDKSLLALLDPDGGVLSLGAVHVSTAAGVRTSPPRRGKWVLETLLGESVSPGFYNSCRIQKDQPGPDSATLPTTLETARNQPDCAVCHERIDPPGLVLERFDTLGRARDQDADLASLSRSLLEKKDQFARNLAERMLAFALGRAVEPCDQPAIAEICEKLAREDYRSSVLILEIARSYPFNYRRPVED